MHEGNSNKSMRRRNNDKEDNETAKDSTATKDIMDDIEVPKEIEITAWYTPQIPINQGPGEYWGLPGLILEINADRTTILCSKIIMNPSENKNSFKGKSSNTKRIQRHCKKESGRNARNVWR